MPVTNIPFLLIKMFMLMRYEEGEAYLHMSRRLPLNVSKNILPLHRQRHNLTGMLDANLFPYQ